MAVETHNKQNEAEYRRRTNEKLKMELQGWYQNYDPSQSEATAFRTELQAVIDLLNNVKQL